MTIEFFGPPGCGKTYLTEQLTGLNRQEIRKKATNPILAKIKFLSRYSPVSIWYRYQIRRIILTENLSYRFHETSLDTMIDSIVLVATSYKLNLRVKNVLDEGLVQRIISLGINYELSVEKIIQIINLFSSIVKKQKVIYIYSSIGDILIGIKDRNRKEAKMDFFDDDVLIEFVSRYEYVCNRVAKYFNFQSITREDFDRFVKENK